MREGRGRYIHADGSIYDGEWQDDAKHGKGKHYWLESDSTWINYQGYWSEGKRHGKGKIKYWNGDEISGNYTNGKLLGTSSKFTMADKTNTEGTFEDDRTVLPPHPSLHPSHITSYNKLQTPFYWHPFPVWYQSFQGTKTALAEENGDLYFGEVDSLGVKHGRGLLISAKQEDGVQDY
jgi:hypothetical protein